MEGPCYSAIGLVLTLVASCLLVLDTAATPAGALTATAQVSAGGRTTCAVMPGGNAYCWGDNAYGQLDNGTTTNGGVGWTHVGKHHCRARR